MTESGTATSGTASTAIANVRANDTVNGVAATAANSTIAISGTWPAGITLDTTTGAVAVAATVQPGSYSISYQLCDLASPTPNCAIVTDTITVSAEIKPVTESGTATSGTASTAIANVRANDTVNGVAATAANSTIAISGTWPAGITLDTTTGAVAVAATVQPGSYSISYQLCDLATPTPNCAIVTDTITVSAEIRPVTESGTATSGTASTAIANVRANDTVNGVAATAANSTIAISGTWPAGITLDTTTGAVAVAATVQPGSYSISYQLCDLATPTPNCAIVTDTITVSAEIKPVTESGTATSGTASTAIANVRANDTVNGVAATAANSTIAISGTWPAGITLDTTTGAVAVAATVQPGSYSISYQLCDLATPTPNCAIVTDTITVSAEIRPVTESGTATSGTASTAIANVRANDTVNGVAATAANSTIAISGTWPAGITLDTTTGAVAVAATVQPGSYSISYQLCDLATPTPNCAIVTDTITVSAEIRPVTESGTATSGTASTAIANVRANDTVNGVAATAANSTIAISGTWPAGITLDTTTGAVAVAATVQPGSYSISYQLCDLATPTPNCAIVTDTITVSAEIKPVTESGTATSGTASTAIANVRANDTVNGVAATAANSTIAISGTWPAGITLDTTTGAVAVAATVQPGSYSVSYQLCDLATPTPNCAIVTDTITVEQPVSAISGTVFIDANRNGNIDGNEPRLANWVVEVVRNGEVVGTARTDTSGAYNFVGLPSGPGYQVVFRDPETNVVYDRISDLTLAANATVIDQNQPIDPSGIIYDAITREPVAGATVRLTDSNGIALPSACFVDVSQANQVTGASGFYRFDLIPGAAPQCPARETLYQIAITPPAGYASASTVFLPGAGPFDPTGLPAPVRITPNFSVPTEDNPLFYLNFRIALGDPDVINNHIPLDPFLTRSPLIVTKTSSRRTASVGDLVPYEITVRNAESAQRAGVDVVDVLPAGMKYVTGSASVNGVASEPVNNGRQVIWRNQVIPANQSTRYSLVLVVGAGVSSGERVNTGVAENASNGSPISNRGTAVVSITPSAVFDCSELLGKVFEDRDGNGYQSKDEPGVPGVRLATVNGLLVTTDEHGRYHIACAAVPDSRIGSNYVLKLDVRTLPLGWDVTTENPRSIRLTRGKFGEVNFGVAPKDGSQRRSPDSGSSAMRREMGE